MNQRNLDFAHGNRWTPYYYNSVKYLSYIDNVSIGHDAAHQDILALDIVQYNSVY